MNSIRCALYALTLFFASSLAANEPATKAPAPSSEVMVSGKAVYLARCAVCHTESGVGGQASAPSLVGNFRLRDEKHVIEQILNGGQYMTGFAFLLNDAEVAAVATYIRNTWGNSHGAVVDSQVAELR